MKITSVEESDTGEWVCSITGLNQGGNLAETKGYINVNVVPPPIFTFYESSTNINIISKNHEVLRIQQGEEMLLLCSADVEALACVFRGPKGQSYSMIDEIQKVSFVI